MYQEITLKCKDCNSDFAFTAGEQEFYAEKGFTNQPQRCVPCRAIKKQAIRESKENVIATCDQCGGEARLPFKPKEDRPVYCSDCYETKKR
jgi:CxxC-x17-CxxC domain-containing protein